MKSTKQKKTKHIMSTCLKLSRLMRQEEIKEYCNACEESADSEPCITCALICCINKRICFHTGFSYFKKEEAENVIKKIKRLHNTITINSDDDSDEEYAISDDDLLKKTGDDEEDKYIPGYMIRKYISLEVEGNRVNSDDIESLYSVDDDIGEFWLEFENAFLNCETLRVCRDCKNKKFKFPITEKKKQNKKLKIK